MQAIIMAGGKGTRLNALTNGEIPKPMVTVCGKPILQWQIECLKRNGIDNIFIVTGYLGEKIRAAFGDGTEMDVQIEYFNEEVPLGTAGALAYLESFIQSEDFLLVFGDCIFDIDINRMIEFHQKRSAIATLFVHPNSHPHDSDLVILDTNGNVKEYSLKTALRRGWYDNIVNAGLYILSHNVCKNIKRGQAHDLEKDVLFPLIPSGKIYGYHSTEYIKDAGIPERIKQISTDVETGIVALRNLQNKQKCVFLDRDGTLNVENGLISRPEDFELLPCAAEAVRKLNVSGFLTIVVTNQPVVARGLCEPETVDEIHRKMQTLLGEYGAYVDAIYYCPHHPDKGFPEENPAYKISCDCRKPGVGMIKQAAGRFNIDLECSWIIGDRTSDIETGKNAGLLTVLVKTGEGGRDGKFSTKPDKVCADLKEAVEYIIKTEANDELSSGY